MQDTGTSASLDDQIRKVLDNAMADLGLVAQTMANALDFPDDRTRAVFYIKAVTVLIERVSKMMIELNKKGVERIKREYGIQERVAPPRHPSFII